MVLPILAVTCAALQARGHFSLVGTWHVLLGAKSGRPDAFIFYGDGRMESRRDDEWGRHLTSGSYKLAGEFLTITSQKHFIDGKLSPKGFRVNSTTLPILWQSKDSFGWVFDSKHTAIFRRIDAATLERTLFVGEWVTIATTSGKDVGKGNLWINADGTFRMQEHSTTKGTYSVTDQGKTVIFAFRSRQFDQTQTMGLSYNPASDTLRDLMTVVYRRQPARNK